MLLTEFNEKKFAKTMWEEGHESGYSSGYNEGRESGYKKAHDEIFNIMDEINKGNNTLDELVSLGYDKELVKQVLEKK